MNDICLYVIIGLLEIGHVEMCEYPIAGEVAWRICVKIDGRFISSWTFLRSELELLRDAYNSSENVYACIDRSRLDELFSVL